MLPIQAIAEQKHSIQNQFVATETPPPTEQVATTMSVLRKYGTIENALFNFDHLTPSEKEVLRELALEEMQATNSKIAQRRSEIKRSRIVEDIAIENETHLAANHPSNIQRRKEINSSIEEAKLRPVYEAVLDVRNLQIDPTSQDMLMVNTSLNRPAAINFFDFVGNPYPIKKTLPEKAANFQIITATENTLFIIPDREFLELTMFVFLEGYDQPLPISVTSNPRMEVTTKINASLPSVAPNAQGSIQTISNDLAIYSNSSDPVMSRFLNGRKVNGAKPIELEGYPSNSQAWMYDGHVYFKTQAILKYGIIEAKRVANWHVFKAQPRQSYWFSINNRDTEVFVSQEGAK